MLRAECQVLPQQEWLRAKYDQVVLRRGERVEFVRMAHAHALEDAPRAGTKPGTSPAPAQDPENQKDPPERAFLKRLMGFEPTTFCMASRRSSQLSYSRNGAAV